MSQTTSDNDNTMSTNNSNTGDDNERRVRHPSVRLFASEFQDASYMFKTDDSEQAPNYTLLPSGQRVNRIFIIGALTDVEERETDNGDFVNARLHDGNGYFYITASRYQPDEANVLRDLETPAHVAVVGKLNHWENQDGEHRIEIVPEEISHVTAEDRYQWILETVEATRDRVARFNEVTDADIESGTAPQDIQMAREKYDIDPNKYLDDAEEVLNSILLRDE